MIRFAFEPTVAGTELRLSGPAGPIPVERWAIEAPERLLRGVDLVQRMLAAESAIADGAVVLVEHAAIAGLSAEEAARLELPPAVDAVAVVESEGLVTRPDFVIRLHWERPGGQALPGARRLGAWLDVGTGWRRMPEPVFSLAEAIGRFAALPPDDESGRMRALAALRELLPGALEQGAARSSDFLGRLRIVVADAFSLDLEGEGEEARLIPVLHRAGAAEGEEPPPLLDPPRQARFGRELFHQHGTARGVYVLGSGDWVALAPGLRRALQVVREVQGAPWAVKRNLLRSPRAFIADRLGEEIDATVLESLFVETRAYGERVRGIGLWQPRVLPWLEVERTDWLGPEASGPETSSPRPRRTRGGILVGDREVVLTPEQARDLRSRIEKAIGGQMTSILWHDPEHGDLEIPADTGSLAAVQRVIDELDAERAGGDRPSAPGTEAERSRLPEALLIEPNESALGFEAQFVRRATPPVASIARRVRTPVKEHQRGGVLWLQRAFEAGRPGVLLADEMGLGKTLQALAFLAWLEEGMELGLVPRAPFLVVAPTGLLANWKAEHDRHLVPPGLGRLVEAFGKGLAALKRPSVDGRPSLDRAALAAADWILTTYETLRDFDLEFGAVHFAAIVFDEAQKIKNPGIRLTDAAKAMQASFTIAMTGTPVENRLADLWCIVDTVHPGLLGELRTFSERYERHPDPDRLRRLRADLDRTDRKTPAFMLRRLRTDHLPDMPPFRIERAHRPMPEVQRRAYDAAIAEARAREGRGAVLRALQRLRSICLHPEPEEADDAALIAGSARLAVAVDALDQISAAGEAALLFLDDLPFMARLQGLLQRRYRLPAPPPIISGDVAGGRRQAIVDRFQRGQGFGVVLLSPRAGGVGLTLTRANHVIHLARWWNPAVEDQCNGRVLRIGQGRTVSIHLPLAVLADGRRSFDLNLDDLLERKRHLHRETLAPPIETPAELAELFERTVT